MAQIWTDSEPDLKSLERSENLSNLMGETGQKQSGHSQKDLNLVIAAKST